MNNKLDHVIQTTLLQKDDINIFLIGEEHAKHDNKKCKGIFEMFHKLTEDLTTNYKSKESNIKIDLMIELRKEDSYGKNSYESESYESLKKKDYNQLEKVRQLFIDYINNKNKNMCDYLRVHWIDPISNGRDFEDEWLPRFFKIVSSEEEDYNNVRSPIWERKEENIVQYFNPRKDPKQINKLLTDNPIIIGEIDKIKKKNIDGILSLFSSIFLNMYEIRKKIFGFKIAVFEMYRTVMDFYTIARIIQKDMKNVIIYAGDNHIENIKLILCSHFNFKCKTIEGKCYLDGSEIQKKNMINSKKFIDAYNDYNKQQHLL